MLVNRGGTTFTQTSSVPIGSRGLIFLKGKMTMTVFQELQRRGLIAQSTNPELIEERLNNEQVTFYVGYDATADSLHVGHFLQLMIMRRLQLAGHVPVVLLGTGTTMVGDPSGKTDMRKMLTVEQINHNADCFAKQMAKFVDFTEGKSHVVRNGDWLMKLNYIELLRDIGVHFTVNRMLAAECFKSRMATSNGLSFLEFNYMIMQSYDFLHLFKSLNCTMQLGGDDQWSNILGGVDLVRRVEHKEVCGMTFTLLTNSEGKKMGKTEKGAIWLDREKTPPYEFFQYWGNVEDADVIKFLKMLTFVPIEEIEEMEKNWQGSQLNKAKEILAYELTKLVHSQEDAEAALASAKALFEGGVNDENMPTTALSEADLIDGSIPLIDAMLLAGLGSSKGEIRRLITQGGVAVDDIKVEDAAFNLERKDFDKGFVIIKKGKKVFHKLTLA